MRASTSRRLLLALSLALLPLAGPAQAPKSGGVLHCRSPEQRKKLLKEHGGSDESEKGVAAGLRWLALHQARDGHWGLHDFNRHARTEPLPKGKVTGDRSTPQTTRRNETAATALALLPFLAAGFSHRAPAGAKAESYHRTVSAGLTWLLRQQYRAGKNRGGFSSEMYTNALATQVVCEAYTLAPTAALKASAQAALNFLVASQHLAGGWRYNPGQQGDLSVTGFVVRALAAGKRAGLRVPAKTLKAVAKFIDSAECKKKGTFSYIPGKEPARDTMTAVAWHCRHLLGVAAREEEWNAGVAVLLAQEKSTNLYLLYYATHALFQRGGKDWEGWNQGEKGASGVRDALVARQDTGKAVPGNKGSWPGTDRGTDHVGGRLGATSFALLTLQVYYSHPRQPAKPQD